MSLTSTGARVALLLLTATAGLSTARAADPAVSGATLAQTGNGRGALGCSSCHGADGSGNAAGGFPVIAGQDAGYIARQLTLIRDGGRPTAVMAPVVASLSDAEIVAVADYYAALPAPDTGAAPPADGRVAEALVTVGDWPGRNMPACNRCHGPGARGVNAAFPGIAGQHATYLKTQLEAFRAGTRKTDPQDLMGTVARQLTDDEISALADWLAARPATRPEAK